MATLEKLFYRILSLIVLGLTGCASGIYHIQSTPPDASVEAIYGDGQRKPLGQTPVNMTSSDVNPKLDAFQIEVSKSGYATQMIFVPGSHFGNTVDLKVTLAADIRNASTIKSETALQEVASSVADIQREIQNRNFEAAIARINRMIASYPNVATYYSLMGNVHYLEKRFDKALTSYRKAAQLDSSSVDLAKIIEKLETMTGGSK